MTTIDRSDAEGVRAAVRERYGRVARGDGSGGGCGAGATALAEQLGYDRAELGAIPDGANLGLSCGNPTVIAGLAPGEVVLDLGSGGGFDCFLAGPHVGAAGRVIGVDMTPDMVSRARRGLAAYRERSGLDNVEFRLGEIEHLPVADASADVVISNCVINLSADKPQVWREVARALRPGGRVAISDVALLRPLPAALAESVEALVGCVAGAVTIDRYRAMVEQAGLVDVELTARPAFIDALAGSGDPVYERLAAALPPGTTAADFATSVAVTARKPDPR